MKINIDRAIESFRINFSGIKEKGLKIFSAGLKRIRTSIPLLPLQDTTWHAAAVFLSTALMSGTTWIC